MSAGHIGGRLLGDSAGLPPKEQRILAPSTVAVTDSNMGAKQCACALTVTDVVNLTIYHVPMTRDMVRRLRDDLWHYDPSNTTTPEGEDAA